MAKRGGVRILALTWMSPHLGVKIYTTDISGAAGYATNDYAPTFNGTSSACPNAAGVMALILSLNPSLSQGQARQIIESSCDKVGGYTYNSSVAGQPNGTWSTDLGYGRVNAFSALQLANPLSVRESARFGNYGCFANKFLHHSNSDFCIANRNSFRKWTGVSMANFSG
jgi:subtilisin family serine protease